MKVSSHRRDRLLTHTPASLPFLENRGSRWELKIPSVTAWSFWWVAPILKRSTKSHLIRTKDTPITQQILRVLEALCQEPEAETNIQIFYYLTDVLSNKWPRGQLASNLVGEAGEYIRTCISDDPHLGKGAGVFISQSLVLLPKDLNCPVFSACHVPVSSHWCPEKVFSPKTKLANEVRLASMGMASIVWTLTVSHTTDLSLPHVRMLTPCGVPMVRLCDT